MNKRFNALVDQHRHWVYTFAFYNLGNHEEAEDATQEVLIRLWNHLPQLKTETITAWLRRVTQNACIDSVRRKKAYTARVVAVTGEDDVVQRAVSSDPTPDLTFESSELHGHIQQALSQIEEPYRSIVILREIQDLKYQEISQCLELPLNTIKSYLHRGRRMLRDQLREAFNEAAG
jgi:RNA polymerase sigma-70 factor (ECF subfamily)